MFLIHTMGSFFGFKYGLRRIESRSGSDPMGKRPSSKGLALTM